MSNTRTGRRYVIERSRDPEVFGFSIRDTFDNEIIRTELPGVTAAIMTRNLNSRAPQELAATRMMVETLLRSHLDNGSARYWTIKPVGNGTDVEITRNDGVLIARCPNPQAANRMIELAKTFELATDTR